MERDQTNESPVSVAVAVFHDRRIAGNAIAALKRNNFQARQIGVISAGDQADNAHRKEGVIGRDHAKGAAVGFVSGLTFGAIVGAADAVLMPNTGATLIAGLVTGAVVGGILGLFLGAVTGMGLRRYDPLIAGRFQRVVVTVAANGRVDEAREVMQYNGGVETADQIPEANFAGRTYVPGMSAVASDHTDEVPATEAHRVL